MNTPDVKKCEKRVTLKIAQSGICILGHSILFRSFIRFFFSVCLYSFSSQNHIVLVSVIWWYKKKNYFSPDWLEHMHRKLLWDVFFLLLVVLLENPKWNRIVDTFHLICTATWVYLIFEWANSEYVVCVMKWPLCLCCVCQSKNGNKIVERVQHVLTQNE